MRRTGRLIATVSIAAAIGVGIFGYPRLASYLQESSWIDDLTSPDVELRQKAIEGLAQHRSRRAVDPLLDVAQMDDDVGPDAARALCRIGDARGVSELKAAFHGVLPQFRRRLTAALCEPPITSEAADVLFAIAIGGRGQEEEKILWMAIDGIKASGEDYVLKFAESLSSPDPGEVRRAVRILGSYREKALPAADALIAILQRGDSRLMNETGSALGYIGAPVVPRLLAALTPEANVVTRRGIVRAIGRMKAGGKSGIPLLIRLLSDEDPAVRSDAVQALADVGRGDANVVAAILDAIEDPGFSNRGGGKKVYRGNPECYDLRVAALYVLSRSGADPKNVTHRLLPLLEDPKLCLAAAALYTITKLQANVDEFATQIDHALETWDLKRLAGDGYRGDSLYSVLAALEQTEHRSEAVAKFLQRILESCPEPYHGQAQSILAQIGSSTAESVLKTLRRIPGSYCPDGVKTLAKKIDGSLVEKLTSSLEDENPKVRRGLCCLFKELGEKAKAAIPAVIGRLDDSDAEVRWAAVNALGSIARGDASQSAHFLRLMRDATPEVSQAALRALGALKSSGKPILPELTEFYGTCIPTGWTRSEILYALVAIDRSADATVRLVKRGLTDTNPWARATAARVLTKVTRLDDEMLAALEAMLNATGSVTMNKDYWRARSAAAKTLVKQGVEGSRRVVASLREGPKDAKRMAARALTMVAKDLREDALLALREALKAADSDVASEAGTALRRLESR